jgi:hypothetical protein
VASSDNAIEEFQDIVRGVEQALGAARLNPR